MVDAVPFGCRPTSTSSGEVSLGCVCSTTASEPRGGQVVPAPPQPVNAGWFFAKSGSMVTSDEPGSPKPPSGAPIRSK